MHVFVGPDRIHFYGDSLFFISTAVLCVVNWKVREKPPKANFMLSQILEN